MSIRAAIDIGSNSVKLLVLELGEDGAYRILHDEERVTGLGSGVNETKQMGRAAIADTLELLRYYISTAKTLGAESIRAAATSAVRDSTNAAELTTPAASELGLEIEVLSGAEEARLSRAAALKELPQTAAPDGSKRVAVFFDIGGGSTELTLCREGEVVADCSLDLGARRLADIGQAIQPVPAFVRETMRKYAVKMFEEQAPRPEADEQVRLAGLGGTASSVVFILRGMKGEVKGDPHKAVVTGIELERLLEMINNLPLEHVKALPNLDPKRADTIYAGIMIIDELLKCYGVSEFTLVDRGLRFGLLLG